MDYDYLLSTAAKAAIEAGNAIMQHYNNQDYVVDEKSDQSPITTADIASNNLINNWLQKTQIPVLSEENKSIDYQERKQWQRLWIVDPLDGTKEFIKRNGEFTVNIALIEEQQPILGVIFLPAKSLLYLGNYHESKSYKLNINKSENYNISLLTESSTIKPTPIQHPMRVLVSSSHPSASTTDFIHKAELVLGNTSTPIGRGSSIKFCSLAEGSACLYPRLAPTMEWDTAAGHAICRAIGVDVIELDTLKELRYNKPNLLNPNFVAGFNTSTINSILSA